MRPEEEAVQRRFHTVKLSPERHPGSCPKCGGQASFSRQYDAMYCPVCDIWTEKPCSSPYCEFCAQRPERPSQAVKPQEVK